MLFSGINPTLASNPIVGGSLSISFELMNNGKTYGIFNSDAFNLHNLHEKEYGQLTSSYNFVDRELKPDQFQRA
jgi:hypothetical protein